MKAIINKSIFISTIILIISISACVQNKEKAVALTDMPVVIMNEKNWNTLTAAESNIIVDKGTELPGTGALLHNKAKGTYICKRCNQPVYNSSSKFESNTGWPSFDDEIKGGVKHVKDADGSRNELLCANCGGHLGHIFYGEGFTKKDVRNCINSLSLSFVALK